METKDYFRLCVALLPLMMVFSLVRSTKAQGSGFTDTFDDPSLSGWEHSPNATVVNGALRIEPGGFAAVQ